MTYRCSFVTDYIYDSDLCFNVYESIIDFCDFFTDIQIINDHIVAGFFPCLDVGDILIDFRDLIAPCIQGYLNRDEVVSIFVFSDTDVGYLFKIFKDDVIIKESEV